MTSNPLRGYLEPDDVAHKLPVPKGSHNASYRAGWRDAWLEAHRLFAGRVERTERPPFYVVDEYEPHTTMTMCSADIGKVTTVDLPASLSGEARPKCPLCGSTDLKLYTLPSGTIRVHCSDNQTHPAYELSSVSDAAKFFTKAEGA